MEKFTRDLPVELTKEELIERGEEMSQCILDVGKLKIERTFLNKRIKPLETRVEELAVIIDSGVEERAVECVWVYNWMTNMRTATRLDTGEMMESEVIPLNKRQAELFEETPPTSNDVEKQEEVGIFAGCPDEPGGCPYFKIGNECAPALCGKNLPPLQRILGATCRHPEGERVTESNGVICGLCKTVLEKSEITRENQPKKAKKSSTSTGKKKAQNQGVNDVVGETPPPPPETSPLSEEVSPEADGTRAPIASTTVEEAAASIAEVSKEPASPAPAVEKDRRCCLPKDRDFMMEGDIRILYCRECRLVHKKEDTSVTPWARLDFVMGEKVTAPAARVEP